LKDEALATDPRDHEIILSSLAVRVTARFVHAPSPQQS
jgi:hypothetical protein